MAAQFTTLFNFNSSTGVGPEAGLFVDANGNLFGTTASGGAYSDGTVFEIKNTGTVAAPSYASAPITLVSFTGANGATPETALTMDANGDLFGTTVSGTGGVDPSFTLSGTAFEIRNTGTIAAPVYGALTTLANFNVNQRPTGLTIDDDGDLLGVTRQGGASGYGTVFEIKNTGTVAAPFYTSGPTTLVNFDGSNGALPYAGLIVDANGNLFGTTENGGANNYGTAFEIKNTGTAAAPVYAGPLTTLVNFTSDSGASPQAGLTADASGNLFGTTSQGGAWGQGTAFEIKNTGTAAAPVYASTPITLVSFYGSAYPAGLIIDANSDLFGTTETGGTYGYGTAFEIKNGGTLANPNYASTLTTLVNFNSSSGGYLMAGLSADANGDLFGTTEEGGWANGGTVFEITGAGFVVAAGPTIAGTVSDQTTTAETPVKPFANVTIGDVNNGATDTLTITLGGASGTLVDGLGFNSLTSAGAGVYRLSGTAAAISSELDALVFTPKAGAPNTSSMTTFTLSNQSSAGGPPVVDTTTTVIDKDPSLAARLTTIFSFNGSDGGVSEGALIADANGDLFGTTGAGALYEIRNTGTPAAPSYASAPTTLLSFNNSSGWSPSPGLSPNAHGDLFGFSNGGVFEIKNTSTVATPIYTTTSTTVASLGALPSPEGGFTFDASGDLFGTTYNGGVGSYGTVFEIKNIGTAAAPIYASTATTRFSFSGWNGSSPLGGLAIDANGNLFGTTSGGGANNTGTVFELQNTGTIGAPVYASPATTLANFGTVAPLTIDARGDVFGVTSYGPYGGGAVFEIKNNGEAAVPSYSGATTLANLAGSDGSGFYAALILDAQGDLFGTSDYGGSAGVGNVFEVKNNGTAAAPLYASTATTVFSFDGSNGRFPQAGLTGDSSGHLLGTTLGGGANGAGTVFEITGAGFVTAASPTISGTNSQTTTSEAPVRPFANVTIGDANVGATDTLTITLGGAGGTLADGLGFNSLTSAGAGVYRLSGTAAAISSELDALVFTPKEGASNASSTTTFTLSDRSNAGGAPVVDTTTTVLNKDIVYPGAIVNAYNGYSLNMMSLNLSNEAQYGTARWINSNLDINGTTYASAYSVEMNISGTLYGETFAGNFSTDAAGAVTGGRVSAYSESVWNGSAWVLANSVTGFSYSAVDFYNAALSGVRSDTSQIEVNILSGNDVINGSTGNDILYGGIGNDFINGGGGIDTVEYAGNRSDYTISRNADGSTSVIDNNDNVGDGADTLYNIAYLAFTDHTVALNSVAAPHIDFNGDSLSDILWQNTGGQASIWEMDGNTRIGGGPVANLGPSWRATETGDFNGDGKSDILWQNTVSGQVSIWEMDGNTRIGGGPVANLGPSWEVVGTGDFNGDGKSDILWQSTSGQTSIWEMDGTTHTGGGPVANLGLSWEVVGTGDFNGDGKSDILWQSTSGQTSIWEMDGTTHTGGGPVANLGPSWKAIGTGDFNHDGLSDILWQNTVSGQVSIWEMDGTTKIGGGPVANLGPSWHAIGTGAGGSDILWQNTSGQTSIWEMDGTTRIGGGPVANLGASWLAIKA